MYPDLAFQLQTLPKRPGVYLFKNSQNEVIYVGKAIDLQQRVKSYFSNSTKIPPKTNKLVSEIRSLELIVTNTEQESLILECDLVKKYSPPFNIRLKDDKSFPYIKIDIQNTWPCVSITRSYSEDGSRYFGPYVDASSLRKTLRFIKKILPFRYCTKTISNIQKPCLNYHLHRCLGPCSGATTEKEYNHVIKQVILFLEGKQRVVVQQLEANMKLAANQFMFERAAQIRDQISAIENFGMDRCIAYKIKGNIDVIGFIQTKEIAYFEIFLIRNSRLAGRDIRIVDGIEQEEPSHIIGSFIKQYYNNTQSIPSEIVVPHQLDEFDLISRWLKSLRGFNVAVSVPIRGDKKKLLDILMENTKQGMQLYLAKQPAAFSPSDILMEMKERLYLSKLPKRIEAFDISNIGGKLSVGSMVVFENGLPRKDCYRRFKIETILQSNDYAMLQEILRRRFRNRTNKCGEWKVIPDLILIDGGKGQLNTAMEVLKEFKLESICLASIAKQHEDVFIPGKADPVNIPRTSTALYLLQRLRDEAHRFAINYHRNLRSKRYQFSILDTVSGIGPKRKKALLKRFGSVKAIRNSSEQELIMADGVTKKLASIIKESL